MIASLEQATPAWYTDTLRASGVLPVGSVIVVEQSANAAFNSSIAHLHLQYSADAPADTPTRLLLKLNSNHSGEAEAPFYQTVMSLPTLPPSVVRCFAADYDSQSGQSYLILDDLSQSHISPVERKQVLLLNGVPQEAVLDGIVDALAKFHAYWWQHPLLGDKFIVRPWYLDQAHFERHVERRQREWAQFKTESGSLVSANTLALYEHALSKLPRLWDAYLDARITPRKNITLTNGDCYLSQFLVPKEAGTTYLIDFQDVTGNFGPYDLAYMFPTFWTAEQRAENGRERRLLERYHQGLVDNGVHGYSLDEMLTDYRYMLALMIFDVVFNATSGSTPDYWQPKMQCLTAAYRDWDCTHLLDVV